jgi:hypothetical protein
MFVSELEEGDMPYQIQHHSATNMIEVSAVGAMNDDLIIEMARKSNLSANQCRSHRILVDITNIQGSGPLISIYRYFTALLWDGLPPNTRIAIYVKSNLNHAFLFDTIASKRTIEARIFTDRLEAESWLGEMLEPVQLKLEYALA